jgi:hypothetical protein
MRATAYTQIISPFGSGYVHEDRGDETRRYLPGIEPAASVDVDDSVGGMTTAMFDELLKTLRAALSLRAA